MFRLDPLTQRRLKRFRELRRGYWSFLILLALGGLSLVSELLVNQRALMVIHRGEWLFPTYGPPISGDRFEQWEYAFETNYRELAKQFDAERGAALNAGQTPAGDTVILPPIPWGPTEIDFAPGRPLARPPAWMDPKWTPAQNYHVLGTDTQGRDIAARLVYGFRLSILAAVVFVLLTYLVGVTLGCLMGYFGGWADLLGQRLVEIWSVIPVLYVVIIINSIVRPNLGLLLAVLVLFSWTSMTYYMRAVTYKEKARDYVAAARVIGVGHVGIIFRHILPNTLAVLVTFVPFYMAAAITSLTALDFLGFGLPPPTPSWGELLRQGTDNLQAPWIVASVFVALCGVLILVTFVGEAVREAFDPKKFTTYR